MSRVYRPVCSRGEEKQQYKMFKVGTKEAFILGPKVAPILGPKMVPILGPKMGPILGPKIDCHGELNESDL